MLRFLGGERALLRRLSTPSHSNLQLRDGSKVAVVGGGPAGAFFSYFLLKLAARLDLRLEVEIFEPRYFNHFGSAGCNHCGGVISEWLVQLLALEGINLPPDVVQRGIDAYMLHTDVGSVRIETPLHEKRIATVYRGGGPGGLKQADWRSFDQFLLDLAISKGVHVRHELVNEVSWRDGYPHITSPAGLGKTYDLLVLASGVNSQLLERIESCGFGFRRPRTATTFISEFHIGQEKIQQSLGSAMHVFLLDIPRLKFAALIPKMGFVTMVLLGKNIDERLVQTFLNAPEVKRLLPPGVEGDRLASCHCFPNINVGGVGQPFADRLLCIGDSGVARLYKDGVGSAYRTAKAAANAAILGGLSTSDFRRHYWPVCRKIAIDNTIGAIVFWVTGIFQSVRFFRRAMIRMTIAEQGMKDRHRRMSMTLWDMFSGSAPYLEIFLRCLTLGFLARLTGNLMWALVFIAYKSIFLGKGHED